MSNSINAENIILGGAQTVIPAAWNGTKKAAQGLYGASQWAWSWVPNPLGVKTAVETRWQNTQYKSTIKTVGAVAAGGLAATAAVIAAPIVVGTGTVATGLTALAAATGAGATTLMAEHPDNSILLNIPLRDPIELRTAGVDPNDPVDPKPSFDAISEKSVAFKQNQPTGMSVTPVKEKPLEDPLKARSLKEQQAKTDKQKDRLIEYASTFTSAYFIFVNRLALPQFEANDNLLMEMTQAATTRTASGEKPNLWDAYIECLKKHGIELSIPQWIRAKFWYFLSDSIGIVPNTLKEVGDGLVKTVRGGVKGEESKASILKLLSITSSFLEKYNGAAQSYVNAGLPDAPPILGDLSVYRKQVIDVLGEESSVAKARALHALDPARDLGVLVMQELCKEFVASIIDDPEIFPSIPFFTELQKVSVCGIRIGIFFDLMEFIFGGLINWIGKKLIKAYAPDALEAIVQKGIDQAMPGKYSFKIGIANALKAQVVDLQAELKNGIPSTPLRFEENNLLNETIARLIKTLELNGCAGDPVALRRKIEEMRDPSAEAQELRDNLNAATLKGAQLLMHHYTQKPEAIEQLFEKLFELSSEPFQPGAQVFTEADYTNAIRTLKEKMSELVKEQVGEAVREKVQGETSENIIKILIGKRIELLDRHGRPNPELQRRDSHGNLLYPYPQQRDADGNLTHQLDAQGKPVYKGLFLEQKEKAVAAAQVLKGLSLRMSRELHLDSLEVANEPLPVPAATPEIIAAEAKLVTAQLNFNTANAILQREERRRPEAQNPYHRMDANNKLEKAKKELKIANEELLIAKEIASLNQLAVTAQGEIAAAPTPLALAVAQKKLRAVTTRLNFAREELPLVRSMEEHNPLEVPNDHLLKNLDNYVKMIDQFTEHAKSLNIDLYDKMVQKLFYRSFGNIYQGTVSLTEQALALQAVEKTYDKSKRLAQQFNEIEAILDENPININVRFREKLKQLEAIDKSFSEYQADPANNVVRFLTMICDFEDISREFSKQDLVLARIQELGSRERLSYEILKHPKKWIDDIRRKIPEQDRPRLFEAIVNLQRNAALSPIPDLMPFHQAVAAEYGAILDKYTNLREAKVNESRQKLQEIRNWTVARKTATETTRNQSRNQLLQGFDKLKRDTDELAGKITASKLPPMHFPARSRVAAGPLGWVADRAANPIIKKVNDLTDSAYDFITSQQITQASARLALGEFIGAHKKPPERGFFSRMMD